jgi:hypothetical protein
LLKLNVRELGSTKGFRSEVYADANPADEAAPFDLAPGGPVPNFGQGWTYDVNITAPELSIKRLTFTPDPAVPGKRMLAKAEVAVTRAGTPEALPPTA